MTRSMLSRVTVALMATVALVFAGAGVAQATDQAGGTNCYKVGSSEYANYRAVVADLAAKGELTKDAAAQLTCDPRVANNHITTKVEKIDDPQANLNGCRGSSNWRIWFYIYGAQAGFHSQNLSWCYDYATVSDWGGACDGGTTGWGTTNAWKWEGCTQNDFLPYWLNGHYPGGVHHSTQGMFSNSAPYVPNLYMRLSIWGHFDGSCDTRYNDTTRNYC